LSKIPKEEVDFRPNPPESSTGELQALKDSFRKGKPDTKTQGLLFATLIVLASWSHRVPRGLKRDSVGELDEGPWKLLYQLTLQRKLIGRSGDTGIQLFAKFGRDPRIKVELLQPYLRVPEDYPEVWHLRSAFGRVLERLLPDRLRYIPGRRKYYSKMGFSDFGLPDITHLDWEQFLWKNRPFGFHIRTHGQNLKNKHRSLRQDNHNLEVILQGVRRDPKTA
jgi:hypothetical protein